MQSFDTTSCVHPPLISKQFIARSLSPSPHSCMPSYHWCIMSQPGFFFFLSSNNLWLISFHTCTNSRHSDTVSSYSVFLFFFSLFFLFCLLAPHSYCTFHSCKPKASYILFTTTVSQCFTSTVKQLLLSLLLQNDLPTEFLA